MHIAGWLSSWIDGTLADIRHAVRMAGKRRAFTILAVATTALGIGAAAATFTIVDTVLVRSLPYKDATRLVSIWATVPGWRNHPALKVVWDQMGIAPNQFAELQKRQTFFDELALARNAGASLIERERKTSIRLGLAQPEFFRLLGVAPISGRLLATEDAKPESVNAAVLSHGLWVRSFGSDAGAIGQTITINFDGNNAVYPIVGVVPKTFEFAEYGFDASPSPDVWIALKTNLQGDAWIDANYAAIAKLKPNVRIEDVERETAQILNASIAPMHRQLVGEEGARVELRKTEQTKAVRGSLYLLLGSTCILLIIACTNVANLLLGQAVTRSHEIALRAAIGASRLRIARQLITESLLLGFAGGGIGTALAWWSVHALLRISPENLPRAGEIQIDARVLVFVLIVSLSTGVIFGLAPVFAALRRDLASTLKWSNAGRGSRQDGLQGLLIIGEMALTFVLLVAAGLLTQSLFRLTTVAVGFQSERLATLKLELADAGYSEAKIRAFADEAVARVAAMPGVEGVTVADRAPFSGRALSTIEIEGVSTVEQGNLFVDHHTIRSNYFSVLGVPVVAGRPFAKSETEDGAKVMIVNSAFAKKFWTVETAVNKRIRAQSDWYTIVGVAQDIREFGLSTEVLPTFYFPGGIAGDQLTVIIRSAADKPSLLSEVRQQIASIDANVVVNPPQQLTSVMWESIASERYRALLINIFAGTAAILACVGLYGVISRFVTSLTREMGIRMALGAQRSSLLWFVLRRSIFLTLAGISTGILAAISTTRYLSDLLYGISVIDAGTYITISIALLLVATAATWLPARRAASVDPAITLRME